jgi:SAM-dependent methyltransferase
MRREAKYLDPSVYIDWLFRRTLGRLPRYRRHAPGIVDIGDSNAVVRDAIQRLVADHATRSSTPTFLDFGARDGVRRTFAHGCIYTGADIDPRTPDLIRADMCACPQIADYSYDVVFSFDVLEHVDRPWDAAAECVRIARPGGLIVCRTLFAYRYHPEPNDYWRFTAQGLERLFTASGRAETLVSGYDIRDRRRNRKGVYLDHRPPIDWLGGWRENWQVLWIGHKAARE